MESKRVAIYARVSTQEQAVNGYSIGEQQERLRMYANAHGWTVVGTFIDPGHSGAKLARPALQELIREAGRKTIDTVLVFKLDRLSRSQKDTMYLIEDVFLKNGIDFVSMSENFDTATPFGRAMVGILSVFAQLERDQIKERTLIGRDARAKEGYFHGGGFAPYGYTYVDGLLKIDPYSSEIVRSAYDLYLKGMNIYQITKELKNRYPAGLKYGKISVSTTESMLTSPICAGKIEWGGEVYDGKHEAIIDYEVFQKVQKSEAAKKKSQPYRKTSFKHKTVLGGLIFCGRCGARYYAKMNTNRKRYYTCYSRGKCARNMVKDPTCRNDSYGVETLTEMILNQIEALDISRDFESYMPPRAVPDSTLDKSIEALDKQISRLVDLYANSAVPIDILTKRLTELNAEKATLSKQREESKSPAPALSIAAANDILDTFADIRQRGEMAELRDLVRSLIDRIVIDGDKVSIHWKFV